MTKSNESYREIITELSTENKQLKQELLKYREKYDEFEMLSDKIHKLKKEYELKIHEMIFCRNKYEELIRQQEKIMNEYKKDANHLLK